MLDSTSLRQLVQSRLLPITATAACALLLNSAMVRADPPRQQQHPPVVNPTPAPTALKSDFPSFPVGDGVRASVPPAPWEPGAAPAAKGTAYIWKIGGGEECFITLDATSVGPENVRLDLTKYLEELRDQLAADHAITVTLQPQVETREGFGRIHFQTKQHGVIIDQYAFYRILIGNRLVVGNSFCPSNSDEVREAVRKLAEAMLMSVWDTQRSIPPGRALKFDLSPEMIKSAENSPAPAGSTAGTVGKPGAATNAVVGLAECSIRQSPLPFPAPQYAPGPPENPPIDLGRGLDFTPPPWPCYFVKRLDPNFIAYSVPDYDGKTRYEDGLSIGFVDSGHTSRHLVEILEKHLAENHTILLGKPEAIVDKRFLGAMHYQEREGDLVCDHLQLARRVGNLEITATTTTHVAPGERGEALIKGINTLNEEMLLSVVPHGQKSPGVHFEIKAFQQPRPADGGLAVGDFPTLSFTSLIEHQPIDLAELRGRMVLVQFWSSADNGFAKQIAFLADLNKRYFIHGLRIVGVSVDGSTQDAAEKCAANHLDWPQYCSGMKYNDPVCRTWGVKQTPDAVLLSPAGEVIWIGPPNPDTFENVLKAALRAYPPLPLTAYDYSLASTLLDKAKSALESHDDAAALKSLAKVPLAMLAEPVLSARLSTLRGQLTAYCTSAVSSAGDLAKRQQYKEAIAQLQPVAAAMAQTPIGVKAAQQLKALTNDPAVAAAIASQAKASDAAAALVSAKGFQDARKMPEAYAAFLSITRSYAGTPAAIAAEQQLRNYEADPAAMEKIERVLLKAPDEDTPRAMLSMAENFAAVKQTAIARKKYQDVIEQFPQSVSARIAAIEAACLVPATQPATGAATTR